MQKATRFLLIFTLAVSCAFTSFGQASPQPQKKPVNLAHADSLFAARQYTQAFDEYLAIHQTGHWTPAMFLKMAYIQEALGRLGESLYYLNLYALASHDPQAEVKMAELAEKYRLEGYEEQPAEAVLVVLRSNYLPIALVLAALALFAFALAVNRARKQPKPSVALALTVVFLLALLLVHVQFTRESRRAILTSGQTYLMNGPSGGASVVDIVGEGHLVRIKSRHDAWLKVEWKEGEAYVRDFLVRKVEL